jgi:hypothetical protein
VCAAAEIAKLVFELRSDAEMLPPWLADDVLAVRCDWPVTLGLSSRGCQAALSGRAQDAVAAGCPHWIDDQ